MYIIIITIANVDGRFCIIYLLPVKFPFLGMEDLMKENMALEEEFKSLESDSVSTSKMYDKSNVFLLLFVFSTLPKNEYLGIVSVIN